MTEIIRLNRLCSLGMYREWKKIEFPKYEFGNNEAER